MNKEEHRKEAERLLAIADAVAREISVKEQVYLVLRAQVHATLAGGK